MEVCPGAAAGRQKDRIKGEGSVSAAGGQGGKLEVEVEGGLIGLEQRAMAHVGRVHSEAAEGEAYVALLDSVLAASSF